MNHAPPASPSTARGVVLHDPQLSEAERARAEGGPAAFSPDMTYRYWLARTWDDERPRLMVVGLNPSTADHQKLDPTLRRIRQFAKDWGLGGFVMTNLFAYRATEPKDMLAADDPVGPENDRHLVDTATDERTGLVLAGWGTHGGYRDRDRAVTRLLDGVKVWSLGRTKDGHPRHPLYVRADAPLVPYVGR